MLGKTLVRCLLITGAMGCAPAQAVPLLDTYIGGNDHGYGDIIGRADYFDVQRAEVIRDAGELRVDIFTNFVNHIGVYGGLTVNGKGIGYGDLLLGGAWTPFVKPGDNSVANLDGHKFDNASNGTHWSYALSFDDAWSTADSGSYTLYALGGDSNLDNLLLSDALFKPGTVLRHGQAVAVDRASATVDALGSGQWTVDRGAKRLSFVLDLDLTVALAGWDYLSLHWGMTCNNDAIEGGVALPPGIPELGGAPPLPEPATLTLFGLGLAGLCMPTLRRHGLRPA
jgi:hypothetical protein